MAQNELSWDSFEPVGPAPRRQPTLRERDTETTIEARLAAQRRADADQRRAEEDQRMQRERLELDRRKAEADLAQKEKDRAAGVGVDTKARESEAKGASFLLRALGANDTYETRGEKSPRSLIGQGLADSAPGLLNTLPGFIGNSPERQISDTAQNQFIAATLRQDSGAAIPEKELERQRQIYFPMPGDGPEAIEEKRRARLLALEGLKVSAGRLEPQTASRYEALVQKWGGGVAAKTDPLVADALAGLPEGVQAAGEDIKGYRLADDDETALLNYVNSPEFTPEGFAAQMTAAATKAGVPVDPAFTANALARGKEMAALRAENKDLKFGGVGYSEVDKAATGNASLMDLGAQAVKNAPESVANLVTGTAAPVFDLITSLNKRERAGVYKTLPDLAGSLLGAAGITDADPAMAEAFGAMLKERYGSVDGFKRAVATDPAGIAGDISLVLTGGGSTATRLPGMAGRAGKAVSTVGKALDPLSLTVAFGTEGPGLLAKATPDLIKDAAAAAPAGLAGWPSGVGGDAVREAAGAGRSAGRAGEPTTRSEAFLQALKDPASTMDDTVNAAQGAVQELRDRASRKYQDAMAQFGKEPVPLNLGDIQRELLKIRPKSYEAMLDAPKRPSDHLAWQNMMDSVNHFVRQADMDPTLAMPLGVDQFKQDLYKIGAKVGDAYDRDAARIAGTAYNAVKNLLVKHDPVYAKTMRDYEDAARQVQQMETTFSLNAARGKTVNPDTATRKLQSIFRNNAYSNYGQRLALGEKLGELDPTGTLMPSLAGQTMSSWRPRSLIGNGMAGLGTTSGAAAMLTGSVSPWALPAAIPAAAAFMPRAVGSLAYGAGKGYGAAERLVSPTAAKGADVLDWLYTKYAGRVDNGIKGDAKGLKTEALASSQANNLSDDLERQRQEELLRRYNMTLPGVDPGFKRGGRVSLDALAKRYGC